MGDTPPPIIEVGPANQTLPIHSVARLPCQATGQPKPKIKWAKNGGPIQASPRFNVYENGTLQIDGKSKILLILTC